MEIATVAPIAILLFVAAIVGVIAIFLRRVVPTNMVHIVQSSKKTVSYGKGQDAGNTYYAWPSWVPKIGVTITKFPESIFKVRLDNYDAYDVARLPFVVDVTAFFRIEKSDVAAQRVSSFEELRTQLTDVLQGAVRRILATNALEGIMESRSELGEQFTKEVDHQIAEWGVKSVKSIEFMDIRDANGQQVIANIMAKEKSRIEKESRVTVAGNNQAAQLAEIEAQRHVEVSKQEAEQAVGIRTAEKDKEVGIARELSTQEIQAQAKVTTEKQMEVEQVRREREATIAANVQVTEAEGEKRARIIEAEGVLEATTREAEGIKAKGVAEADAQEKMLMAPVSAQLALAKEIGDNDGYQTYLIAVERVKAGQVVGVQVAEALKEAELKVISTGGGDVLGGVSKLADMVTPAGGTSLAGMLSALSATDEGAALLGAVTSRLTGAKPAPLPASTEAVAS